MTAFDPQAFKQTTRAHAGTCRRADVLTSSLQPWTFIMLNVRAALLQRHAADLLQRSSEILSILSQALSAAHHYEELSRRSDAALAERGLKRADLPRVAYIELTKGY